MKDNKKFWILFAIIIALSIGTQLVGQEVEDKKVLKKEYRNKQDMRQRQMMMKHRRKQMRTRRMIQTLVVAGVSYYIGYKVGEDSWMDKKKDKRDKPIIWRKD